MTPIEKAMKAAEAEIGRQVSIQVKDHEDGKWGAAFAHFIPRSEMFGECQINGAIDLEPVIRAALLAVRDPEPDVCRVGKAAGERAVSEADPDAAHDCNVHEVQPAAIFTAMIDAILDDQPKGETFPEREAVTGAPSGGGGDKSTHGRTINGAPSTYGGGRSSASTPNNGTPCSYGGFGGPYQPKGDE